jgi:hypothetical protein
MIVQCEQACCEIVVEIGKNMCSISMLMGYLAIKFVTFAILKILIVDNSFGPVKITISRRLESAS